MGLSTLICVQIFGQCGVQPVTVTDYCPDQYAEFVVNDGDPSTEYEWYGDAAGTISYGSGLASVDGKHYVSPTTYGTGSGTQNFWYQQHMTGVVDGPVPADGTVAGWEADATNSATFPYQMGFDADVDFRLNSVTIALYSWGVPAGGPFRVLIDVDGVASPWITFTGADMVLVGAQKYIVKIDIDYDGLGNGLPVTAGAGKVIRAFTNGVAEPAG